MQGEHLTTVVDISIHALRKESDHRHGVKPRGLSISIHALRKESDAKLRISRRMSSTYFNPRSP